MAAPFYAVQTTGVQPGGGAAGRDGSRQANAQRLLDREAQTRSWAAPLPDFAAMPRYTEPARMRAEWDTRDTMNHRLWSDTMSAGAKAVTPTMLAHHPTQGVDMNMPAVSRQDPRSYVTGPVYYPDAPAIRPGEQIQQRPMVPARSMFQNAWTTELDMEGHAPNMAREMRAVVKEENRFRMEDSSARMMDRMFQHQWNLPAPTNLQEQLQAAEALRPKQDDYRVPM